ncbi:uncharacterized protein ACMZJ9_012753 isoform 2-T3 [Mantella aurantiaca]
MMDHYHTIKPLECTVVGPGVVVKVEEEEIYSPQNNQNPVTNTGGDRIKREMDVKAEQSAGTSSRRKRKSDRRKRIPENNLGSVSLKPEIVIKTEEDREDSSMKNEEDRSPKTRTGHNMKPEIEVKVEENEQSYTTGDQQLEERDSSPAASPDFFLVQIKEEEEDMSFGMDYQQHGEKVVHPQTSSGYVEAVREKDGRIHRMSSKMFIDIGQLIQLVQERPELYNPKTPSYADRYKKKKAWDEICAVVVPDWELCSEKEKNIKVKTVKTRWRSMKDNYAKELRIQRREQRSGSRSSKRRVYAYFSLLDFLRPVMQLRQTENIMDELDDQAEEETLACLDDSRSTSSPLIINDEVATTSSQVIEATENNPPPASAAPTRRVLATPRRRAQAARQPMRAEAPRRRVQQPAPILEEVLHFFIEEARMQRGNHYNLAMSFIPHLEDIPMERLAAATIDILSVMEAYKQEVPPRPYVAVPQHDVNVSYSPPQSMQSGYPGCPHPSQQPGYHGFPPTPPPP